MSNIKTVIIAITTLIFSATLLSALYDVKSMIIPGVNYIYNELGINTAPNMVITVIFDWRGFDTLGEALVLLSAVLVVLVVFGKGTLGGKDK